MHVVIFEGSRWPTFAPLSLSRPVFTLASGASTLLEKQIRHLRPTRLTLWVRPGLESYCQRHILPKLEVPTRLNKPLDDEPALLVSGRTLHLAPFECPTESAAVVDNNSIIAARTVSPGLSPTDALRRTDDWMKLFDLPRMDSKLRMAAYLWDLLTWNEASLADDAVHFRQRCKPVAPGPYHLLNEADVCSEDGVTLGPGCVIDASKGPVLLAAGANVGANAVVQGPCFLGPNAQLSPLALIRPGTTIGPVCKVGGEVGNSILMGYCNKAHDGYLGDSYLGEWVNLGAGTATSNLKNTYGQITLRIGKMNLPTGKQFLGSLIGDHSKTAIGTRLMTGSYLGYCSMIAASKLPPPFVPSFTFLTDGGAQPYEKEKARGVMTEVFGRRKRAWTDADGQMMDYVAETAALVEGT